MDNKVIDNNVVNTITEKIKKTRLLIGIGIIAMILGTMLPYIKYTIFGVTTTTKLLKYWKGKITLILLILNLIYIFKDYIGKMNPSLTENTIWKKLSEAEKYAIIPTLCAIVLTIWETIQIDIGFGFYNIGFYSYWFGVICIVIYLVINRGKIIVPGKKQVQQISNYEEFQSTNNPNLNYNNGINNNMNPYYNNGMNNNINPNYNNRINNNMNPYYNNGMNNNINPNYNNGMNNNINPNYNNGMNNNINPNYNNGMNNNINPNYNNGMNNNINQNYNNEMNNNIDTKKNNM